MLDPNFRINSADMAQLSAAIVERGGSFSFQAHGSSMFPFIRDGDTLAIRPINPAELDVGDVAFYKSAPDRLTAHRIVRVQAHSDGILLLARGDASTGATEIVQPNQVLGCVVSLQRRGHIIRLDDPLRRRLALLWVRTAPLGPGLLRLARLGQRAAIWFLTHLQALRAYRLLGRRLVQPRLHLRQATAGDAASLSNLYRLARIPELDDPGAEMAAWFESLPDSDADVFLATIGGRLAGAAVLHPSREGADLKSGWWLLGLLVRTRYRGAGVGEKLVRRALTRAAAQGSPQVRLLVCKRNRPALALFEKVGFRSDVIPDLDRYLGAKADDEECQAILMSMRATASKQAER